jgi:biopolymer transport protein ExbB/TolQ
MSTTITWFRDGGPLMTVIVVIATIGFVVIAERFYVIELRAKNNGRRFIERIIQLVRADKIDEAIKECAKSTAVLPDMGLVILRSRSRDEIELHKVADAAALTVLPRLTRRLSYLRTLSGVCLLVGALGTVFKLQQTFAGAGAPGIVDRAAHVLAGVGASLSPVALALLAASLLTIGRAYLASQSENLIEQVQEFSARLINALIDRPDVRLGHR